MLSHRPEKVPRGLFLDESRSYGRHAHKMVIFTGSMVIFTGSIESKSENSRIAGEFNNYDAGVVVVKHIRNSSACLFRKTAGSNDCCFGVKNPAIKGLGALQDKTAIAIIESDHFRFSKVQFGVMNAFPSLFNLNIVVSGGGLDAMDGFGAVRFKSVKT